MVIWTRFCFSFLKTFLIFYGARKVLVVFNFIQLIFIIIKKCVSMNGCISVLSGIYLVDCMYNGHSFQIIENDMKTLCWNRIESVNTKPHWNGYKKKTNLPLYFFEAWDDRRLLSTIIIGKYPMECVIYMCKNLFRYFFNIIFVLIINR